MFILICTMAMWYFNFRLPRSTVRIHDIYSCCDLHLVLWRDGVWVVLPFVAKDQMCGLQGMYSVFPCISHVHVACFQYTSCAVCYQLLSTSDSQYLSFWEG